MLTLHAENKITFAVNVQGTATKPAVRVVIGSEPGLSFAATAIGNDEYEAIITLPPTMLAGMQPLKIEVVLNGRLFTPINTVVAVDEKVEIVTTPEIKPVEVASVLPEIKEIHKPKIVVTSPQIKSAPQIKMADVANEADSKNNKKGSLKVSPKIQAKKPLIERSKTIPITIIKGDIIYK